jgi:hypothetical protein
MASTKLQRTFSAEGDNIYKWTYSFWVKRGTLGGDQAMAAAYYSATYEGRIYFRGTDQLEVYDYWNGSYTLQKKTNRLFRDTSAWYHIVVSNDNTQASADDRTKIYVNGVQETSFAINTQFPQNQRNSFNNDYTKYFGSYGSGDYLDGSMSHIHFIDGTAYAPTEFGETDSTTGEWKIKTNVSVTYGTNGFFILKDGNSVTDQSGNSNNFTVGAGTLTKTEDNPSNVFATLNPLNLQTGTKPILQYGNTSVSGASDGGTEFNGSSTLGMSTGKFYMEFKSTVSSNVHTMIGITSNPSEDARSDHWMGTQSYSYGYYANDGKYYNGNTAYTYGNTYTSDIIGVALDLDNNKLYFSKNGTWQNSGVPTSGSTGTGAISITDNEYFFGVSDASGTYISSGDCNFGNGYFGTTAVSSAGTNASNNGIFEYDVPTGYTALSTKGLNL